MNIDGIIKEMLQSTYNQDNPKLIKKIQTCFPVPNDLKIKWYDVYNYHGKLVGIVLTDNGIIYKSKPNKTKETKKSVTQYQIIPWEYYDPDYYKIKKIKEGYGLFMESEQLASFYNKELARFFDILSKEYDSQFIIDATIAEELTIGNLNSVAFHAAYGLDNSRTGHGIYAEEVGAKLDLLHGEKVAVVGRDNAKNGPDKIVNRLPVQCKYYKTANGSINACFKKNHDTGAMTFRYFQLDGKTPMQIEVPKDQYEKAIALFEKRILKGEVPGINNPNAARSIIRRGKLTYKQTLNLAKAGTIESLTYDLATGIISCSAVGGISAIAVFSISYWQTRDTKKAGRAALQAGLEVFGPSFAGRVIAEQIARTSFSKSLIPLSTTITRMLGPKSVQSIMNSFRVIAGKQKIYGAAAQKSFAKALRTNALTQLIIFGVTSIPDTLKVINGRITVAQYTKNLTTGAAAIAGGYGGAIIGAKFGAKAPGGIVQKGICVAGGAVGGFITATTANCIASIIKEDDCLIYSRMINAVISNMAIDYLLSEDELKKLIEFLDNDTKNLKKLISDLIKEPKQYSKIEDFVKPYFEKAISDRTLINQEKEVEMCESMDETIIGISKEVCNDEM